MWKLIITDDQGQHTVVNLVRDDYRIGRSEENPIRLTERNISRQHALLRRTGSGFSIQDLRSSNGLFVNGVRITGVQPLGHRDLVQLGDYRVEVVDETLDTQEQGHHPYPGPVPILPSRLPHRLVVLIGPNQGSEYALEGDRYLIGRDDDCDFRIDHGSVSRIHAEVRRLDEDHFEIIDKGSANGLRINGHERPRAVLDGRDVVELGDVVLKYIMKGQVFRVDAAEGERIAAMSGATLPPPEAEARLPLGAPLIAALGGALLIFGVLFWMFRSPESEPVVPSVAAQAEGDPGTDGGVARAMALLQNGDVFAAHEEVTRLARAGELPPGQEVDNIESAWAEAMLRLAESEAEPAQQLELLREVQLCETAPPVLRDAAAKRIAALVEAGAPTTPSDEASEADGDAFEELGEEETPQAPAHRVEDLSELPVEEPAIPAPDGQP